MTNSKRGRNHGYWSRRYRELQERDQHEALMIQQITELHAHFKYQDVKAQ